MRLHSCLLTAACAVGFLGAAAAAPYPRSNMPRAVDLGPAQNAAPGKEVTLTIPLKLRDAERIPALLQSLYTPGSPDYHHFLTAQQFAARFGPSAATIEQLTRHFQAAGFTVTRSATAQLQITGTVQAVQAEFGVRMHEYQEGPTAHTPGFRFRAPDRAAQVPAGVSGAVEGVLGLSTMPRFHPNIMSAARLAVTHAKPVSGGGAPATADPPGVWTVADFGQYYDVDPLYQRGLSGKGETVGIMTLASFTPKDAYDYWTAVGLKVKNPRIKEVQVDGGSGPPSAASGSLETTLDVEQSGGIAPGAKIRVYEAPNTSQGFVDVFATAVDEDMADTLSISWGEWEWFDIIPADNVTDPTTGENATTLRALNDVLLQAALQGQSVFCAAGDSGAYDANNPGVFPVPLFSQALSVDDPAAQQFITTAGGTTLPGPQSYYVPNGTLTVNIPQERAWSWDYLTPVCSALGYDPISCGIFPAGGGGGVSNYVWRPFYQWFTRGMASTPGADLEDTSGTPLPPGVNLPVKLAKGFPGRNVPDISLNSDPNTGYVVIYSGGAQNCDSSGVCTFYGGTSFAAPQMNGVTSLFVQALHHRVGLLNFPLYAIASSPEAYRGDDAPLRDIRSGNNWGWQSRPGYDQATGVGVPNVANLLEALERPLF